MSKASEKKTVIYKSTPGKLLLYAIVIVNGSSRNMKNLKIVDEQLDNYYNKKFRGNSKSWNKKWFKDKVQENVFYVLVASGTLDTGVGPVVPPPPPPPPFRPAPHVQVIFPANRRMWQALPLNFSLQKAGVIQ